MKLGLGHLVDPRLLPLVAETRAFYVDRPAGRGPSSLEELHAARAARLAPVPSRPPAIEELATAGGRTVPVRIHEPAGPPSGVLLQIHGGGFYMGLAADDDVANRRLADALGLVVVGVDYRLAPERPWPSAPDDCETAAVWMVEHAEERWGTDQFAIAGFSAGSTLALVTMLRLRERGAPDFGAAVLQFGTYDLSGQTEAGRLIADEYFLEAYAGGIAQRTHPHLSPAYADRADLAGLPPTLMLVGEHDVLLEDNLAMATRLQAAGVDADLRVYPASPHGFTKHPTPMARAAQEDIDGWLADGLDL